MCIGPPPNMDSKLHWSEESSVCECVLTVYTPGCGMASGVGSPAFVFNPGDVGSILPALSHHIKVRYLGDKTEKLHRHYVSVKYLLTPVCVKMLHN